LIAGPQGVATHNIAFHWTVLYDTTNALGEGRNWYEL